MVVSYDLRIKYVIKKVIGKRVVRKGNKNTSKKYRYPNSFTINLFFTSKIKKDKVEHEQQTNYNCVQICGRRSFKKAYVLKLLLDYLPDRRLRKSQGEINLSERIKEKRSDSCKVEKEKKLYPHTLYFLVTLFSPILAKSKTPLIESVMGFTLLVSTYSHSTGTSFIRYPILVARYKSSTSNPAVTAEPDISLNPPWSLFIFSNNISAASLLKTLNPH